jgi:hypothetical protein
VPKIAPWLHLSMIPRWNTRGALFRPSRLLTFEMRAASFSLVMLVSLGCAGKSEDAEVQGCVSDHPAAEPFDVGDVTVASPAPGSTAPAAAPPTAASIAAECTANAGSGCDPARFISKGAAACVAALNGFEVGLAPWQVALVYHHGLDTVVWNVMNELQDNGAEGYSGATLTLSATDGNVLKQSAYDVTP